VSDKMTCPACGATLSAITQAFQNDMPEPDEPSRLEGHINAAEFWLMQAGNWEFPNPIRTECLQLAAIHAPLAQALSASPTMGRDAAMGG
jgi:hypothetical protein